MSHKFLALGMVVLATGVYGLAAAEPTLAQKGTMKAWQEQIDGQLKFANDNCGTKITATVDWDAFFKVDLDKASKSGGAVSVGQYCGDAIAAVSNLCTISKDGKEAVTKHITSVACKYGGPGKRSIALAKGVFTFTVDFQVGSNSVDIRQDLAKKM